MTFILYDRFFSLDEQTGALKTFWCAIGKRYNTAVQLIEQYPIQTLNCFNQNIPSLYVFCKATNVLEFERGHLIDLDKQFAGNIKIFKYYKPTTISLSQSTLSRNWDNIQSIFMLHTRIDVTHSDWIETKEPISHRIVYKICFNNESTHSLVAHRINSIKTFGYPSVETFVPFDHECELYLNHIFPINRKTDTTKYSYMTTVQSHFMDFVSMLDTFYGLTQVVRARILTTNTMNVTAREVTHSPGDIADIFLSHVSIVDLLVGRVYENERCIEYHSKENELTFIMIKLCVHKKTLFIIIQNSKFATKPQCSDNENLNIIPCNDEYEMLTSFFRLYSQGMIFRVIEKDIHFIMATQRYKSSSYIILERILYTKVLYKQFSVHCVVSEDGKCVRFNRNSIILFDDLDSSKEIITNQHYIGSKEVYLPELLADSTLEPGSSFVDHVKNLKPTKISKYTDVKNCVDKFLNVGTVSTNELLDRIMNDELLTDSSKYSLILESLIELSNKIRIPINLLYSLSVAQIAHRLLFYTNLRNGVFMLLDREESIRYFYRSSDSTISAKREIIKHLRFPNDTKIYKLDRSQSGSKINDYNTGGLFSNVIQSLISIHMSGNVIDNYFELMCPSPKYLPLMSSLVQNESEILATKNAVIWSRQQLFCDCSIVSFDFVLHHSSIVALFGLDLHNCAILYGFELKSFFYNIFPTPQTFNDNCITILRLPFTFIMDNDSLRIHNINTYDKIDSLNDTSTYLVIMRFVVTHILQRCHTKYQPLSTLMSDNIRDIEKYSTRLKLHKNILNAIGGMLSAGQINTTILNVVNALSRKIILWTVDNCINCDSTLEEDSDTDVNSTSFSDHIYSIDPPKNLISIESDSFTFIFSRSHFQYGDKNNNSNCIENLRNHIVNKLSNALSECTVLTDSSIRQLVKLRLNFVTGNLFQLSSRRFFYIDTVNGMQVLISNELNNASVSKALFYLNQDANLVKILQKNRSLRLTHLKRTWNLTDTRHLLIWYMIQYDRRKHRTYADDKNDLVDWGELRRLENIIDDPNIVFQNRQIEDNCYALFSLVRRSDCVFYFIKILTSSYSNLYFLNCSTPPITDSKHLGSMCLPSDKESLILHFVQLFFKLYQKSFTTTPSSSSQRRSGNTAET